MTATITTALLKQIAFQLGLSLVVVCEFAAQHGVTIDDTPRDETRERDMDTMTITQEQFEAMCTDARITSASGRIITGRLGITIAPAAPPQAMVRLAREIGDRRPRGDMPHPASAALAALQHMEQAVRDLPSVNLNYDHISRTAALKACGADV